MYDCCFSKLPGTMRKKLKQPEGYLTFFTGHSVWNFGTLLVLLTLRNQLTQAKNTKLLAFKIIQSETPYNIIFRTSAMKNFETIESTVHGLIRFRTPNGYGIVHKKPLAAPTSMLIVRKEETMT